MNVSPADLLVCWADVHWLRQRGGGGRATTLARPRSCWLRNCAFSTSRTLTTRANISTSPWRCLISCAAVANRSLASRSSARSLRSLSGTCPVLGLCSHVPLRSQHVPLQHEDSMGKKVQYDLGQWWSPPTRG